MTNIISDGQMVTQGPSGAAIGFVTQGWDFFEGKITTITQQALNLINQLAVLPQVASTQFHVDFPSLEGLTAFTAPPRPSLPDIAFQPIPVPEAPNLAIPDAPAMTAAPEFDVAKPPLMALPAQPGALTATDPGEAPTLATIVLPEMADLALPTLLTVTLPELPVLPTFAGTDPGSAPSLPNLAGAAFTEQPYTPKLLDDLVPTIQRGIASGQLLLPAVEQAIFQRGRDRAQQVHRAALQAIDEEFTGRGFKQPPGAWGARRAEQRRKSDAEVLGLNRDLTVQFHTEAIKNVQFAVERGIALEQVLIGQHAQVMDRALQSARLLLDTHVALYNAQVSSYNAGIERLKADASVFRDRLQAAIETYKAQIDGQRLTSDINRALVDQYQAQVTALVEKYRGAVAGAQAQAELELGRIEGYRAKVQAFTARVEAYGAQWNGFRSAVEAQQAGFRSYEIGVNAYAARVQAWGEGERTKSARFETDIKASGLLLEGFRARVQETLAKLQVEQGRIAALGTQSDAVARMYQADGQIASAANDANTRAFEAQAGYFDRRAQVQLREAEIKMQDNARIAATMGEAIRGAAQALATLAASAMSAVNFSAGVSGSGSESSSWSHSLSKSLGWSWAGETVDNNSVPSY
jgi:hypothetical protein